MKKFFFLLLTTTIIVSCNDVDSDSYCPTWKGFQYYANDSSQINGSVNPGDSLYVIACQSQKGHLIYYATYSWTLTVDTIPTAGGPSGTSLLTYSKGINYDGATDHLGNYIGNKDPKAHFLIPENVVTGTYRVTFQAEYKFSGHGTEPGGIYNAQSPYKGNISNQGSELFGKSTGSFDIRITGK